MRAMAEAAEVIDRGDIGAMCQPDADDRQWASASLALKEAWRGTGETDWKLDSWLERRQFQILDEIVRVESKPK
jgi:hypothetical protein